MANSTTGQGTKTGNRGGAVRISAVVCTLNRAAYLAKAVESLVNQTCPKDHFEIIVVDNGSTDNTKEVVQQFSQSALIRYIHEPIKGLSQARNTGWQAASGKYVAYLDDDAIAHPRWLEKMLKAFETVKPAPASVGGKVFPIWEAERPAWLTDRMLSAYAIVDWGNRAKFLKPSSPEHHVGCNVAYSREVLEACGGFNVNLGRKGKNLLSNDENLIRKYIDSHGLGIYYDPEILVEHLVPKERVTRRFMLRRHFWQGVSDVVLWYEESPSPPGRLWSLLSGLEGLIWVGLYLAYFFVRSFLRRPIRVLRDLTKVETARNYFFRSVEHVSASFGQSCSYLQHTTGSRVAGTAKPVSGGQAIGTTFRLPPKNWNRVTWWTYPYLAFKRHLIGIGGLALLVIVGLYIAGALVEPLRWYLVGIASGLVILSGGVLVLFYARATLNNTIADLRTQISDVNMALRASQGRLAGLEREISRLNVGNFPLSRQFKRRLTSGDLHHFATEWAPRLGLNLNTVALAYIAHRICLAEDTCIGRLSGDIETMLLRVMVARSVKEPNLEVLEIGTLFGIGVAMIHENCRGLSNKIHLTVIDPLIGHLGPHERSPLDPLTKAPATRETFIHNMQRMDIPKSDYTIIQKLSTEDEAKEQASKRRYDLLIIDADHSYFGVKHDFHSYRHLVKPGGYIIFDDYGNPRWPGLTNFVDKEVAKMPGLEFVGTDVFTAVFRAITPQHPAK